MPVEYPARKRIYPEPVVNVVYSVAATADELLDSIAGVRPIGHALEIVRFFAPANVIRTVTGVPKPSEVVEEILDRVQEELRPPLLGRPGFPRFRRLRRIL